MIAKFAASGISRLAYRWRVGDMVLFEVCNEGIRAHLYKMKRPTKPVNGGIAVSWKEDSKYIAILDSSLRWIAQASEDTASIGDESIEIHCMKEGSVHHVTCRGHAITNKQSWELWQNHHLPVLSVDLVAKEIAPDLASQWRQRMDQLSSLRAQCGD